MVLDVCHTLDKSKLHGALVTAQLGFAGFEVLTKAALLNNSSCIVFTLYRNIVAFMLLGPVAFFLERKDWPSSSLYLFFSSLILGLLGVTINQVSYLLGLRYTSAVYASAMRNLTPMFTLILGVICRVEKVNVKRRDGLATVCGTILGLGGALVLSAYQGPIFLKSDDVSNLPTTQHHMAMHEHQSIFSRFMFIALMVNQWKFGSICLILSFLSFSLNLILQARILARHPMPVSVAASTILASLVQLFFLAIIFEREAISWKLTDGTFAIVVYSGLVASGLVSAFQSWGVKKGGPILVAAYQPLETVLVAVLGSMFLKETLYLGSLFGAILIVLGLYLQNWGREEQRRLNSVSQPDDPHGSLKQRLLPVEASCNGITSC